jgi:hypothetical protein
MLSLQKIWFQVHDFDIFILKFFKFEFFFLGLVLEIFDFIKNCIVFKFIEYLLGTGSIIRIDGEHSGNDLFKIFRVNTIVFESGLKFASTQIKPFLSEAKTWELEY